MTLTAAVLCLALNIYYEARNEPIEGQYAVANVTLNRVSHADYPNDVCLVVYQNRQFSWTLEETLTPPKGKSWDRSMSIAHEVIKTKNAGDVTFGATHFHADYVVPKWSHKLVPTRKIGRHIFYKRPSPTVGG